MPSEPARSSPVRHGEQRVRLAPGCIARLGLAPRLTARALRVGAPGDYEVIGAVNPYVGCWGVFKGCFFDGEAVEAADGAERRAMSPQLGAEAVEVAGRTLVPSVDLEQGQVVFRLARRARTGQYALVSVDAASGPVLEVCRGFSDLAVDSR